MAKHSPTSPLNWLSSFIKHLHEALEVHSTIAHSKFVHIKFSTIHILHIFLPN